MLKGWKRIEKNDIKIIQKYNESLINVEYFNSIIYQIHSRMIYKNIDNNIVIAKASSIMGTYSIIRFFGDSTLNNELNRNSITLRGHDINGKKDKFGDEYVYDSNECASLIGPKYNYFRKALRKYKEKITYKTGYHDDILKIVELYPKHQLKLLKNIKEFIDLVTITRVYHDNNILGFSIVENINKNNGIIIQELFNKDVGIRYASYLIHYYNCVNNKDKMLNAGGSRNKNIKFAKQKLRPKFLLKINRIIPDTKLNKNDWQYFKKNMIS